MRKRQIDPGAVSSDDRIFEQIRANVAFEHIVVAVLSGAALCGAISLILQLAAMLVAGVFSFGVLLTIFMNALIAGFVFFLVGFAGGALIVTPLFRMLEKSRRRSGWPYGAAALGVAVASLIAASTMPFAGAPSLFAIFAVIASSIATALIFARRMKPLWAAATAEEAAAEQAGASSQFRLH